MTIVKINEVESTNYRRAERIEVEISRSQNEQLYNYRDF